MKFSLSYAIIIVLLTVIIYPARCLAQESPFTDGYSGSEGKWYASSDFQEKVNTLPSTATASVFIPVLFGVGVKNISPNFGDPRSGGRSHEGEDIMAIKGTPIISPTPAVVLRTGYGESAGNYVYTANPGGETFVYMHLDRIGESVVPGLVLEQGSLIGYVGNSGNASGGAAHLHFEIHDTADKPTNPFLRLTGELSLSEKINYLSIILAKATDSQALSQFLVNNFRSTFTSAFSQNIILPASINSLLIPIGTAVESVAVNNQVSFNRDLRYTMTAEAVRALQKLLNAKGFVVAQSGSGSPGKETTYFGLATVAAVKRFQTAYGIKPVYGNVGPLTRAVLNSLFF